jgi:fermentation-respiration switch protein FrsA (DUF1100 family)
MKKIVTYFLFTILLFFILTGSLLLYTSYYIYDIVLDPKGDKSMFNGYLDQSVTAIPKALIDINEDVFINAYDDIQLHGYQFPNTSNVWVIVVHGYMGEGADMGWAINQFYQQGYNVLSPDLRSHGKSEGEYIALGWEDRIDIVSWIEYLVNEDNNREIILFGVSMGATAILNAGGEMLPNNVKMIIEDSGFTSSKDVFSYHLANTFDIPTFPLLPVVGWVGELRTGIPLEEGPMYQLERCKLPILFIHGDKDALMPITMMYQMYNNYQGPKEKLVIKNAGHVTSNEVDNKTYWDTITTFIATYLL